MLVIISKLFSLTDPDIVFITVRQKKLGLKWQNTCEILVNINIRSVISISRYVNFKYWIIDIRAVLISIISTII